MEMDLDRLHEIIRETTSGFRKGEAIQQKQTGNINVVEVFAMPHDSEADGKLIKVDCHFITVGVDKEKAEEYRDELVLILKTYPQPERLAGGPSYIEVGAEIGSQDAALQLFALGQVLGFWKVITPETLGITGQEAIQTAGMGLVMISGFKNDSGDEVIFRPKSSYQKNGCLFCNRRATIEAVCGGDTAIRCCDNEECKKAAARLAKEAHQSIRQSK